MNKPNLSEQFTERVQIAEINNCQDIEQLRQVTLGLYMAYRAAQPIVKEYYRKKLGIDEMT